MFPRIYCLWFISPSLWAYSMALWPLDQGSGSKDHSFTGDIEDGITGFGKDLMKVLLEETKADENLVISPITIHKVMSMITVGSPLVSKTFKQLEKALHLPSGPRKLKAYKKIVDQYDAISNKKREGTTLRLAATMLVNNGFTVKEDFKGHMKKFFSATTQTFNTPDEGVTLVNDWAEEKTHGMIKEILTDDDVTDNTKLILASACYFKSDWKTKFNKSLTKPMEFTLGSKEKVQIEKGMNTYDTDFNYAETEDFEVLELPYKNEDFSMYIALPKEKSMEALNTVASGFCTRQFRDKLRKRTIDRVQLPSFDATSDIDLKKPLQALGIKDAFGPGADFSKISDKKLYIGMAKTKTVVKVDEEGSEAAAVAVVGAETYSMGPPPLRFIVNRPFLFMIHDKKRDIPLFIGRIVDPQ